MKSANSHTAPWSEGAARTGWSGISYHYGKNRALHQFDLQIKAGETLALLGPNGAGKSTAIKLLLGLLKAQLGQVCIEGQSAQTSEAREQLGAVLQVSGLPAQLSVVEQVRLHASYYRAPRDVLALLKELHLDHLQQRRLNTLSGGEKRRLEFALALVGNPKWLVLDEPTVGIDINEREHIVTLLASLKAKGMSILLTTHLIEEAERLADRIAYLDQGELKFVGTLAQLQSRCQWVELEFRSTLAKPDLESICQTFGEESLLDLEDRRWQIKSTEPNRLLRQLLQADAHFELIQMQHPNLQQALHQMHSTLNVHQSG